MPACRVVRERAKQARNQYERAVEIFEKREAKIAMNVRALVGLARTELALGDEASAAALADQALVLAESFVEGGSASYLIGLSLAVRGEILAARGKPDDARKAFRTASEHLESTLGPAHPATKDALLRVTS